MHMRYKSLFFAIALSLSSLGATAQTYSPQLDHLLRSREASQLQAQLGVIEALVPVFHDTWALPTLEEEALLLDAVARGTLDAGEAEVKLLHFIEQYPHSAYLPFAYSRLGDWYYVREQYGAAIPWYRRVDTSLLPDKMAVATDYYYAYSLMREGRNEEALRRFEPLTYADTFRDDAEFYTGYLYMKTGNNEKGIAHLQKVLNHPTYGSYANAYTAEGELSLMHYTQALQIAQQGLLSSRLEPSVRLSLLKTAGLAAANLSQREQAVSYLTDYVNQTTNPGRVELLTLGKTLIELGQASNAIHHLEQVPSGKKDFMSQLAYYYLGLGHLATRNTTTAGSAFDQAVSINAYAPLTETAAYNSALASYSKAPGRISQGSKRLVSFIQQYPKSEYYSLAIGYLEDAYLNEPNTSAALQELNSISPLPERLKRTRDRVKLGKANKALASGNTSEAAGQYQDIIRTAGDATSVAEAYLWMGEAAYQQGKYQEAIQNTNKYLQNKPAELELNNNAYYTLGYAHFNLKQYAETEKAFRSYLSNSGNIGSNERTNVLNRLGDIQVQKRDYAGAQQFFVQAEQAGGNEADYSLYSRGIVLGLQKDYRGKAAVLAQLPTRYPASNLAPKALYEQGQSLSLMGDEDNARAAFERFFQLHKTSELAPKVGLQLALSYFNQNRLQDAAQAYERVILNYPKSNEAKIALQDLKSISIQLNQIDRYNNLARTSGLDSGLSQGELDQMSYLAAERLIASGSPQEAKTALDKYITDYPNGAYIDRATYSKALIEYNTQNYTNAALALERLGSRTIDSNLAIEVYNLLGASYDKLNQPGRAAEAYLAKSRYTTNINDRSNAVRLSGERAVKSQSIEFIYSLADDVTKGNIKVDDQTKATIIGYAAENYAHTNNKAQAISYAKRLKELPNVGTHDMADVILALDLFDKGKYSEVQRSMNALTTRGSSDAYWLARGFILLADTYVKLGDKDSARTYYESVKGSYPNTTDGIIEMINQRLDTL